ncbi:hypothetical protein B5X24_HaOG203900 [Helicoverpa armigera]|uniref:Peptidase S1 domain-containing protein n=1 Tax=Helicoverpa armigera TaxID=29058 RepID=A0A2W1BW60_HELAM|nr:hypothetical protein B5X24_HaOG203900 [Helicoverpa armigera]
MNKMGVDVSMKSDKEVYLLNSPYSEYQPEAWLCGGVLISTTKVLTSAACLTEVSHIYVIAGYKKYVSGISIQDNDCTRFKKNKIIRIIIPKAFKSETWIKFDIGVGVVEKPYDFLDITYRSICSYEPEAVAINYDVNLEVPNTAAVAFGWGGSRAREPGVDGDLNSNYLMSAQTLITHKEVCQKLFPDSVDYYFLCTTASTASEDIFSNVKCNQTDSNGTLPKECLDPVEVNISRKSLSDSNYTTTTRIDDKNVTLDEFNRTSRKQGDENIYGGICQNDHGGPLIAFSGDKEVVIGIALNSVYDEEYQCKGPFLYLSTAHSKVLIKCLLASVDETRKVCESMNYAVDERIIKWPDVKSKVPKECEDGGCQAVRIRPQVRLLDLIDDAIEQ